MSRRLFRFISASALVVVLALGAGWAVAQGQSARAALKEVQAAAQKWQKDAVLTNVATQAAAADGAASEWSYLFYSPASKQAYAVSVKNGKIVDQHPVGPYLTDSVGEFADSAAVMATAKANGLKAQMPTAMSLLMMGQKTKNPGAYWMIGTGATPGEIAVWIDARTGKFFRKQEVK